MHVLCLENLNKSLTEVHNNCFWNKDKCFTNYPNIGIHGPILMKQTMRPYNKLSKYMNSWSYLNETIHEILQQNIQI